ncbi:MAG: hypothetical protein JO257_02090 [Deltaproteobacteria bacterium]|nr:hypothetical protein [Deltaproteobacteria bacterium]
MRSLPLLLLLAATPAAADSFLGATGGIMIPLGDSKSDNSGWSDQVGSSPKLGARVGAIGESNVGGMVTADWTPISYNYQSQAVDVGAHRFRIQAHVLFEKQVAPKLTVAGRAGGGIDIAHASADTTILGTTFHASDTDVGWAFELGGGVWWSLGDVDIGGEVALPFGGHNHKAQAGKNEITFDYTSYDLDLLFGVRLRSK